MPYSDIQSVFETLFLEKYNSFFENVQATASFQIHTVKLGYMRVHEKGNVEEGELIPVWDFLERKLFPMTRRSLMLRRGRIRAF